MPGTQFTVCETGNSLYTFWVGFDPFDVYNFTEDALGEASAPSFILESNGKAILEQV